MHRISKSSKKHGKKKAKHSSSLKSAAKLNGTKKENVDSPLGRYGFTPTGEKKRILLNAFDMNGIGHTRYAHLNLSAARLLTIPVSANGKIQSTKARPKTV